MEFSLSLYQCGNSSCVCCELDLYIHPSNDYVHRLFYLLTWMFWSRLSSWWHCCIPSIVVGSAISWGFYWPGVVYRWLLRLGPGPKTFQQFHLLYSLEVVQSIVHHCISCRCSFHMELVAGIRWWRILMIMAHTSLVYIEHFRNPHRWQKVNAIGILFL